MKLSSAQQKILGLAVDDFFGLWEVAATLHDLLPEHSEMESKIAARQAVKELVIDGLICLYRGNNFSGEEKPLPQEEINAMLWDNKNWDWDAPKAAEHIRLAATKKGENIYYGQKTQ
jgi:hypothetical protein